MTPENQDNAHAAAPEPVDDVEATTRGDLDRYGIVARPHVTYEWNGYRYSNSSDAIAAAKRAAR